ncbi:MAG: hypothetical protein ACKOGB_07165, partial [Betaproteobacteria bacterium]
MSALALSIVLLAALLHAGWNLVAKRSGGDHHFLFLVVVFIAQPDWNSAEAFKVLGRPNLYFGVAAGNLDSINNHYPADRTGRTDDAYPPGGVAGKRPDRAT